jgi:hypothetical protein
MRGLYIFIFVLFMFDMLCSRGLNMRLDSGDLFVSLLVESGA